MLNTIYALLPTWVVALSLLGAAVSFVIVYIQQQRKGLIEYKPPLTLGLATVLLALSGCYVWLWRDPTVSLAERGAILRVLLLLLSLGLIHYNWGAVRLFVSISTGEENR